MVVCPRNTRLNQLTGLLPTHCPYKAENSANKHVNKDVTALHLICLRNKLKSWVLE